MHVFFPYEVPSPEALPSCWISLDVTLMQSQPWHPVTFLSSPIPSQTVLPHSLTHSLGSPVSVLEAQASISIETLLFPSTLLLALSHDQLGFYQ